MKVEFQAIQGYAYGLIQPSVLLQFQVIDHKTSQNSQLLSSLMNSESLSGKDPKFNLTRSNFDFTSDQSMFTKIISALSLSCGDKQFSAVNVFKENGTLGFLIPTLSTDLVWHNMVAVSQFIKEQHDDLAPERVNEFVHNIISSHRKLLPGGANVVPLISAAVDRKIPVKVFMRDYLIFGYGAGSRIFRSTITDREAAVGVSLASNKVDTNRILKMSGLPVANQARIQTIQQASHFAKKFGYPVALKPDNQSRGRGVRTNILDQSELEICFAELKETYNTLLLEHHIPGDYHRINLMGGEIILAVRRIPPQVTGDGISTVHSLIDKLNASPERNGPNPVQNKVIIDEDVNRCLQKQQLDLGDILERGRTIYLKSISTMSRGGNQEHIGERIHPVNIDLFRKVARIMRLEVLGIDLISPNISVPWYLNGAKICEVNAQPQLHLSTSHAYPMLLKRYVPPQPRIELNISNEEPSNQEQLFDTAAETVRLSLTAKDVFEHGSPVQYFDQLTIANDVSEKEKEKLRKFLVSVPLQ